jgi:hypothetical protein
MSPALGDVSRHQRNGASRPDASRPDVVINNFHNAAVLSNDPCVGVAPGPPSRRSRS